MLDRKLSYILAAAAISGFALTATPGAASPLTGGLASGNAAVPEVSEGLVQKVHGWHCRARKGWYRGHRYWHRHRRACQDYSYRYRPYRYGFGAPSIVRFLQKRGIAPVFSAFVLVILLVGAFSAAAFLLSGPVSEWIDSAPEISRKVQQKLAAFRTPVDAVVKASEQVETIREGASSPAVQKVVVQQPGILSKAADTLFGGLSMAAVTFVLLLFLLASGTLFYEKMIGVLPTFSDKKRALTIAYDVEREVSHYLLTITAINAALGVFIAAAMSITGMPNPLLWGVAAALLNFIPYIGAFAGITMVGLVSLISFDSLTYAIVPPLVYLAAAVIEGQFLTPVLLGRRLELNSVAIFIFVAMWTWLWGIVGAIIAVPLLVSIKVFCDHFEGLASFGEFLSGRPKEDDELIEDTTASAS